MNPELEAIDREIAELDKARADLAAERKKILQRDSYQKAIEGLSNMGVELAQHNWQVYEDITVFGGSQRHAYVHSLRLNKGSQYTGDKDYYEASLALMTDNLTDWSLGYWVTTGSGKAFKTKKMRYFQGSLEQARQWAAKEMYDKLLSVRKRITKKLEAL